MSLNQSLKNSNVLFKTDLHPDALTTQTNTLSSNPFEATTKDYLEALNSDRIPNSFESHVLSSTTKTLQNPNFFPIVTKKNISLSETHLIKQETSSEAAILEVWRCKECGVREHETPLKRKGPDGTRVSIQLFFYNCFLKLNSLVSL
jgi:hypothetical protein